MNMELGVSEIVEDPPVEDVDPETWRDLPTILALAVIAVIVWLTRRR